MSIPAWPLVRWPRRPGPPRRRATGLRSSRRSAAKLLTRDEARRIAANLMAADCGKHERASAVRHPALSRGLLIVTVLL